MSLERAENGAGAAQRRLKVGIAGLGAGAVQVVRALEHSPQVQLIAAADLRPEALATFQERYGGRGYDSVEKLCGDPDVEVIWISTPNQFHCEHTVLAAQHGKNIVVEKPMALSLAEAQRMVDAVEANGVRLLCGHTASLMVAYQAMRDVIRSEELGKVGAINILSYTDWMFRPRMPQEVEIATGGGVPYRQGPHHVDTIRLLGGGRVKSVRAATGQWFQGRNRDVPGYYSALLEFEEGHSGVLIHNGYGYFSSQELLAGAGRRIGADAGLLRKELRTGASDETEAKNERRFGGRDESTPQAGVAAATESTVRWRGFQPDLGIVLVSCEGGDIRQSPNGLYIYDGSGQREVAIAGIADERTAELDEMYDAIVENRPNRHDGRWGMATLEVVLGIMQSSREHREIEMQHQCPAY